MAHSVRDQPNPAWEGLHGRQLECARLDELLQEPARGPGGALVVVGRQGMGKTALLDYAARTAVGFDLRRVRAVPAEQDFPYAGLQLLCGPLVDTAPALPAAQQQALMAALGRTGGEEPDRSLVSLATLNLLTAVSATRPLCCVVDDAHWLDPLSAEALTFAARRSRRQLVLLFGEREQPSSRLGAIPRLRLRPLSDRDCHALLVARWPGKVDTAVAERIVLEAEGVPAALVMAFDGVDAATLAGGYAVPPPRTNRRSSGRGCGDSATSLAPEARRLLLAAAADPTGDPLVLWRAARLLGVGAAAAGLLEARGLVRFDRRVTFRSPCLRSEFYAAATYEERADVHRALADAERGGANDHRRAWHLALATAGLDDDVADLLEGQVEVAQRRGGLSARAAFLERAALLTCDSATRARRALSAAHAAQELGDGDSALALLSTAESAEPGPGQRRRIRLERARIRAVSRRDEEALRDLRDAARQLEVTERPSAREAYLEAIVIGMSAGEAIADETMVDVARSARAALDDSPAHPVDQLLSGLLIRVLDGYPAAVRPLAKAFEAMRQQPLDPTHGRWVWLASCLAADVWDEEAWGVLSARQRRHLDLRDPATPAHAPLLVAVRDIFRGDLHAATRTVAIEVAPQPAAPGGRASYPSVLLAAWQGRAEVLQGPLARVRREAAERKDGLTLAASYLAEAVYNNSVGHYAEAMRAAQTASSSKYLAFCGWALTELVEAAARAGEEAMAADALGRLVERTSAASTTWSLGVEASARALMANGPDAEALHREALSRLAETSIGVHLGRAQLLYGEWLRRENRRVDARAPLRAARDRFVAMGADRFAARANRELLATGGKARKRDVSSTRQLTPQESRIAQLACGGATNPEIAGQLFVSPRTVEYHLGKVFAKLAITSRTELHLVLGAARATGGGPLRGGDIYGGGQAEAG